MPSWAWNCVHVNALNSMLGNFAKFLTFPFNGICIAKAEPAPRHYRKIAVAILAVMSFMLGGQSVFALTLIENLDDSNFLNVSVVPSVRPILGSFTTDNKFYTVGIGSVFSITVKNLSSQNCFDNSLVINLGTTTIPSNILWTFTPESNINLTTNTFIQRSSTITTGSNYVLQPLTKYYFHSSGLCNPTSFSIKTNSEQSMFTGFLTDINGYTLPLDGIATQTSPTQQTYLANSIPFSGTYNNLSTFDKIEIQLTAETQGISLIPYLRDIPLVSGTAFAYSTSVVVPYIGNYSGRIRLYDSVNAFGTSWVALADFGLSTTTIGILPFVSDNLLSTKFPFSYVYEINGFWQSMFSQTNSSLMIVLPFGSFGNITLISAEMLTAIPFVSQIKLLLIFGMWVAFAMFVYRKVLTVHNKEVKI